MPVTQGWDHQATMLRWSANTQFEGVCFMKMEDSIKQDLKSSKHNINFSSLPLKNPLVSFLLEKIYCDSQGHSSHPKLNIASLSRQPTNCTVQSKHSPTNPQPRFGPIPQINHPSRHKQKTNEYEIPCHACRKHKQDQEGWTSIGHVYEVCPG